MSQLVYPGIGIKQGEGKELVRNQKGRVLLFIIVIVGGAVLSP
jgi:hypothetical protein